MNVCAICLLLTILLLAPAPLWARVIRPTSLSLVAGPVRLAVSDTFLITGTSGSIRRACAEEATNAAAPCPLPVILFPLGSTEPEPGQTDRLIFGLRHCQVSPTTPLAVTGHTCSLGTEATNLRLSRQRAERVASLLRDRGYTVATVSGKGATDPVSTNPTKRHLNRRVTLAQWTSRLPGRQHQPTTMERSEMQRMRTWRQRVHRTTPVALLAILLQAGNALAMTVPASGSFAYDLYDIGVNQILLGPVGFTGGVACMCVAAILAIRQMILPAAGVVLGGAFLLRANTVVETIGALIS